MSRLRIPLGIILMLAVTACATQNARTPVDTLKKTIVTATESYDATMYALGALYKVGLLSDQEAANIVGAGNEFRKLLLQAATAADDGTAQKHLKQAQEILNAVTAFLQKARSRESGTHPQSSHPTGPVRPDRYRESSGHLPGRWSGSGVRAGAGDARVGRAEVLRQVKLRR